ncbi:MAG: hypothetical protein KQA41_02655 [Candidatus Aenigmarchaeota archaeon]|nr:hypothetical protein [Candidatus Aenigmarchaeota archaeon]
MKKKAQAAMEYLMTYGWAILIIVVVIAALYAMGVFKQKSTVPYTGFTGDVTYSAHNATHLVLIAGRDLTYNGNTYSAGDRIFVDLQGICTWSTNSCSVTINYDVDGVLKPASGTLYKTW